MKLRKILKSLLVLSSLLIGLGLTAGISARADDSGPYVSEPLTGATVTVPGTPAHSSGVVDLKDTVPLFDPAGGVDSRSLLDGTSWMTDKILLNLGNGTAYYRVATSEYVRTTDVNYADGSGDTSVPLNVVYVNHAGQTLKSQSFKVGSGQVTSLMADLTGLKQMPSLSGYRFDKATADTTKDTVTYTYNPTVTFKFEDTAGQQLAADEVVSGEPGTKYTLPDKSTDAAFKGYTLKQIKSGTPSGVYQDTPQTFTYIYAKKGTTSTVASTPDQASGSVTVRYQTLSGIKLADDVVLTGTRGTAYQATSKTVNGYRLLKVVGSATGSFKSTDQTVTYVYTKSTAKEFSPFMIYAKRGFYRYAHPTFKVNERLAHVKKQPRIKAKTFKVVGIARSSQGRLRYRLANGSYVTAKATYVANLYWQGKAYRRLTVINPKGINVYTHATFSARNRGKHLRRGTVVKIKGLVRRGYMTRYQLTDGHVVTGNKQWVSVK